MIGESSYDVAVIYEKIGDLHCLEGDDTDDDDGDDDEG